MLLIKTDYNFHSSIDLYIATLIHVRLLPELMGKGKEINKDFFSIGE